ncbi:MAG: hypothetical protein H6767_01575 [Candidatus Peribacteria bacterium]|nr:MAG: hypothetical protein H6767_01575 [Candidatus Peribacteria bacterium]
MQYTKKIIGNDGILVGIDIKKIDPYSQPNIHTIEHSIFDQKTLLPKVEKCI